MNRYMYKGENLERDKKIIFLFYRTLKEGCEPDELIFESGVMVSDAVCAPKNPRKDSTRTYCRGTVGFRGVPKEHLRRRTRADGETNYYDLYHDTSMTTMSAGFVFALEIGGEVKGRVDVKYE